MANTAVYTEIGQLPAGTTTVDITIATEVTASRTPTGAIVKVTYATSIDSITSHMGLSWGVTDFTNLGCIAVNNEHNVATTDSYRKHQETNILEILTAGTPNIIRSATIAAITGGVRITTLQTSTQYQVEVTLIFGTSCFAFSSDGDGSVDDGEPFDIPHGFSTHPGAGFYGYCLEDISSAADARFGLGYHSYDGATITQAAVAWAYQNNQSVTTVAQARLTGDGTNNRCCWAIANTGGASSGIEITAIDGTNITYTGRDTSANSNKWVGLLLECEDCETEVQIINSPTDDTVDWNFNGLVFEPQFVQLLMGRIQNINNNESDADAGPGSIASMDAEGREHTVSWATQDNITLGTTNTSSEISTDIFCPTHTHSASHTMDTHTFTTDGWDFLAVDIAAANGQTRLWPILAIGVADAVSSSNLPGYHGANRGIMRGVARNIG